MITFGVNTVVINDKYDEVLLTLRSDLPVWCLPGGAIEPRETLAQAAIRETYEETGAEIRLERLVGVYSRPLWRDGGNHEVLFYGRQIGGELHPLDGEALEVAYFPISALPDTLLWWHRERIADAFDGPARFVRMQGATLLPTLNKLSYDESQTLLKEGSDLQKDLIEHLIKPPERDESIVELHNE